MFGFPAIKVVYIYGMLKKTGSSFLRYTRYLTNMSRLARVSRLSFRFLWLWFHIVCMSHYKSIKPKDHNLYQKIIDAKSKQNCLLISRYNTEDKRVWRYCNNKYSFTESKTDLILLLLKTERRTASTTVAQVWRWYKFDMMFDFHFECHIDIVCLLKILLTKLLWKLTILSASHNNDSCFVNFPKESVNNILYLTFERDQL